MQHSLMVQTILLYLIRQPLGASSGRLGIMTQAVSAMAAGIIIAMTGCWQLALAILACVPVIGGATYIHMKFIVRHFLCISYH